MSCNVRGIADFTKRKQVFKYLREQNCDVLFLQETHSTPKHEKLWRSQWGGNIFYDHGTSQARGVAILTAKSLDFQHVNTIRSKNGRSLIVEVKVNNRKLVWANIYAPNNDDPEFHFSILQQIQELKVDQTIIAGDFNLHLDPTKDIKSFRKKGKVQLSRSADIVNTFLDENSWVDVWRAINLDKFQFTWKGGKPITMSRIDYFIIPAHMMNFVQNCSIQPGFLSDHSFLVLDLKFNDQSRGRGMWKMNTTYLAEKEYVDSVNEIIDYSQYRYDECDPALWWDMMKLDVTEFSREYSKNRARDKRIKKETVLQKIKTLEKKLPCINLSSPKAIAIIEKVNTKLDEEKKKIK